MRNFCVITGGPGSGKTTLIQALAAQGHHHMPEAGRAIIRQQRAIAGIALPWDDRAAFAEQMLGWELRSHEAASALTGTVFFDRGLVDIIGYFRLCGLPVPDHMRRAAALFRYGGPIFIAPPWPEIFAQDAERRQDFDEARETYDVMCRAYGDCGYEPVTLPPVSVVDRCGFILSRIG